jgi:mono/diheme cytochrome c family protein
MPGPPPSPAADPPAHAKSRAMSRSALLLSLTVVLATGGGPALRSAAAERVSFNEHIRPLFAKHCVACHGGVQQASGLSFIYRTSALAEADSGARPIVPGDLEASELVARVTATDPDLRMPPVDHGPALSKEEIAHLTQWIEQGAEWEELWSFVPPKRHEPPQVKNPQWVRSPVDAFVAARLEREGLAPSPEADKREWLRRASFDLLGLPPSSDLTARFLADESPQAYERVVDELLASPHFGERWASMWLDIARYADTVGFERDPHRNIWPYRDWLIRAHNADMPYDEFVIKQLAGDMLPEASLDDVLATALHRNTQTNAEGGTDDEEFRTAAVIDRISTTWQAFGGLTFGCTQCHSHPYDPIEHDEFYKFYAVFNTSRDTDVEEDFPLLGVPNDYKQVAKAESLDREIRQLAAAIREPLVAVATDDGTWHGLDIDQARSTGNAKLITRRDETSGATEVVAQGTITSGSQFTLSAPRPAGVHRLTALRIDALPHDLEAALRVPELGFVVSRLHLNVYLPGEDKPSEVFFRYVFCDDPQPNLDPLESLDDNPNGWGIYTRLYRPAWGVFVLRDPIDLPEGSRLELVLKQNRNTVGSHALVIQRGRYSASSDERFSQITAGASWQAMFDSWHNTRDERAKIASTHVPVMGELADEVKRQTFVFVRGNFLDKGEHVEPGVPRVFGEGTNEIDNRLKVAQWFVSPEQPLTARVMVNRVWEQLFGLGIVETVGDFGTSGLAPSHPELLDDLAVRFRTDHKWSVKQLLRELVLSSTYRQQAAADPATLEADPRNVLLSRGPRQRLSAEMVRDQALVLSGRFSAKMHGPPVMPPQPDGIWRSVYNGSVWETATNEDRYRRAVYTYWKRTSGYPSMMTFDVPSREVCTVRRIATSTPLQALVVLNDPAFVELAQGLAERMVKEGGAAPHERIAWAFERASGVPPTEGMLGALTSLHDEAAQSFDAANEQMKKLGATSEAYALTIVANAILNLDDVITR